MKKYKIPKGKHTSYTLHRIFHRFWPKKVRVGTKLEFKAKILTEPYDIRPDRDQDDRHKLIGMPLRVFSKSSKNAALMTFQPNAKNGTWDLSPYFNEDFAFEFGQELPVKANQEFEGSIEFVDKNKAVINIRSGETFLVPTEYEWDKAGANYTGIILPWHGGKDNDGNSIGGVSPVDIEILMDWEFTNK